MEQYIHDLGLTLDDVKVDQEGRLYILIEEKAPGTFYKEIGLPEEYQTFGNVEIIRNLTQK